VASFERIQSATERHAASRDSIILKLIKLLLGLWSGFDRWDDADAVTGMAARSAFLVNASTMSVRRLSRSYLGSVLAEMNSSPESLPPIVNGYPRANVLPTEVYRRPVDEFIWRRRNGGTMTETQEAFEERLRAIAEADMMAAERDENEVILRHAPHVTGYRRVIHPELSRSGTCGLCVVASQRIYRVADLMPMHGGDNCDVLPVTDDDDPGLRLNDDDLKTIYAAAGSTAADDLVNTRISINEHGELGPVLVKQGDHFRSAKEAGRPEYVRPTPATIRAATSREIANLRQQLAEAQKRYDEMPDDVKYRDDGTTTSESIAVFRSIRYLTEYLGVLELKLRTIAA
jgi:hypothetical protein